MRGVWLAGNRERRLPADEGAMNRHVLIETCKWGKWVPADEGGGHVPQLVHQRAPAQGGQAAGAPVLHLEAQRLTRAQRVQGGGGKGACEARSVTEEAGLGQKQVKEEGREGVGGSVSCHGSSRARARHLEEVDGPVGHPCQLLGQPLQRNLRRRDRARVVHRRRRGSGGGGGGGGRGHGDGDGGEARQTFDDGHARAGPRLGPALRAAQPPATTAAAVGRCGGPAARRLETAEAAV